MKAETTSALPLKAVISAVSDISRWRLLKELASSEPRMVVDLATRIGQTDNNTAKHLHVLMKVGIVERWNRLYRLAERFRPAPGSQELDFGVCVLRLGRF